MLSASRCGEQSGLAPRQVVAMLSLKQKQLLASYQLSLQKGDWFVFELMASDIQGLVDLGAMALATDVLVVLRIFTRDRSAIQRLCAAHPRVQRFVRDSIDAADAQLAYCGERGRQIQSAIRTERDRQSLA
jgi:hypothetical protein